LWRRLLADAADRLGESGLERPEVEARRLVEEASGYEGSSFHSVLDRRPQPSQVANLERMLDRRLAGEPLQYALGRWSFRGLDIMVDHRVLIPRPETEVVAEVAISEAERLGGEVVCADLGTGSGVIAMSLVADLPAAVVFATDVSADALEVASANLGGLGRAAARVRLREGWWFDALDEDLRGQLDLVVSNPPYVADREDLPREVMEWEPTMALLAGPSGRECIEAIIDAALDWLATPGTLVVEIAPHQAEAVAARARSVGFGDVALHRDLAGRERVLVARR
jgi:release factor glutamine methyltransferase